MTNRFCLQNQNIILYLNYFRETGGTQILLQCYYFKEQNALSHYKIQKYQLHPVLLVLLQVPMRHKRNQIKKYELVIIIYVSYQIKKKIELKLQLIFKTHFVNVNSKDNFLFQHSGSCQSILRVTKMVFKISKSAYSFSTLRSYYVPNKLSEMTKLSFTYNLKTIFLLPTIILYNFPIPSLLRHAASLHCSVPSSTVCNILHGVVLQDIPPLHESHIAWGAFQTSTCDA